MLCTFSTLVDGRFECGVSQEYPGQYECIPLSKVRGEGGLKILGGGMPPVLLDPISDQKNVIFHTRFQTRTQKSIHVFRIT